MIIPGTALAVAELKLFQLCVCTSAENHFYPKYIFECVMVPDFQTEYTSAKCQSWILSATESNIISGEKSDRLHGVLICPISFLGFLVQPFRRCIWSSISPGAAGLTDHTWGRVQTSERWGKRRILAGISYPRLVLTPAVTTVIWFSVVPAPKAHWLPSSRGRIWITLQAL